MAGKPVTRQIYNQIKKYINDNGFVAKDGPKVMKKFGYGVSTIRNIRNTDNYDKYVERVFRFHGNPNKTQTVDYSKQQDFNAGYIRMKLNDILRELGYIQSPLESARDQQDEIIRLLGNIAIAAIVILGLLGAIFVELLFMGSAL